LKLNFTSYQNFLKIQPL